MDRRDAWVTLTSVPMLPPLTRAALLERLGSPEAVCAADVAQLVRGGAAPDVARRLAKAVADGAGARERAHAESLGFAVLTPDDAGWPELLRQMPDPPAALFVRGALVPDDDLSVAVVGARRCSEWARGFTERLATDLARAGITVVSGGARGVDAASHRGALAGGGRTIAVAGCGLSVPYPREHEGLYDEIARQGACVSELPCAVHPQPLFFPWRNRLIAALAKVTVVVEGARKSGASITARMALEYGREVGAVPGRAGAPEAAVPNGLLRDGAGVVESAADVLAVLHPFELIDPPEPLPRTPPVGLEAEIFAAVGDDPLPAAAIAARCGRQAPAIMAALTRLELAAHVRALPGGRWVRA